MMNQTLYKPLIEPTPIFEKKWGEASIPFVSISCVTYNHASYLRQAVDGFLMQKTTFPVEILIHDDASTDGTIDIIKEYQLKFPKVIYPMFQTENQFLQGIRGMMARFNFPRARGKYIALCEGDDYWTDPLKLQKQVDFLETNPSYILCFHKVKTLIDNKLQEDEILEKRYQAVHDKKEITTLDLLKNKNFIHTCSVMFRKKELQIPFEFYYSPVGDYFLLILLSEEGLIYRIDDYMGVYRRGSGGYSTLSPLDMQRKIVQYHIAILSYLSKDEHKKVFIENTLRSFFEFEQILIAQINKKAETPNRLNLKDVKKKILKKLFGN